MRRRRKDRLDRDPGSGGATSGCRFPADPDGTLEIVRDGTLRVGVTESDPWVDLADPDDPRGVEPELVRRFAASLNTEIEWIDGSEEELMGALKQGQLDLVVGGLTKKTPWKSKGEIRALLDREGKP